MRKGYTYKDFCTPEEVEIYKRVKKRAMKLSDAGREVVARLTYGVIGDGTRSDKQFLQTKHGRFRLANSTASDNSTEAAAHDRMGVPTIYMGEFDSIIPFLRTHDCPLSFDSFFDAVARELNSMP
jgi:hypothetical protein